MGCLKFETRDINHINELIKAFTPIDISVWTQGFLNLKPVKSLSLHELALTSRSRYYGVYLEVTKYEQSFKWYTCHDKFMFRIEIVMQSLSLGARGINFDLPYIVEEITPVHGRNILKEWYLKNPHDVGVHEERTAGAPNCSGSVKVLWDKLDTLETELGWFIDASNRVMR